MSSARRRLLLAAAVLLLIVMVLLVASVVTPWGRQDSCLDAGGAWHDGLCIGARPGG